jgi:2-phosphoglycolate phosphatase
VFDAVLFDLDGTLADTAPDMARTVNMMLERRGRAMVPVAHVRPHVSSGARGMIRAAFGVGTDDPSFKDLRQEFLDIYADNLCIDSVLFPGIAQLLDRLDNEGIAWGVVTNKFERLARPVLDGLGVGARARVIVGGDTCARAKPFADPLLHASAQLGIAPDRSLYVGDDERDVQAARAAGMPVLAAGYGYLGDGPPPEAWGADAVVDTAGGIGEWLAQ